MCALVGGGGCCILGCFNSLLEMRGKSTITRRWLGYTGFNSLLEMPGETATQKAAVPASVSILYWRCDEYIVLKLTENWKVFQFSIGDAAQ